MCSRRHLPPELLQDDASCSFGQSSLHPGFAHLHSNFTITYTTPFGYGGTTPIGHHAETICHHSLSVLHSPRSHVARHCYLQSCREIRKGSNGLVCPVWC